MAKFDFPSSPSNNDEYTANGVTWKWNGTVWNRVEGVGAQGSQGVQGAQGHQGVQGTTGGGGGTGAQGHQGHQGVQGATGAQGHQGRQGAQGVQGAAGAQGHQGVQGAQGAQGAAAAGSNGIVRQIQFANGPGSQVFANTNGSWVTIMSLSITTTTNDARVKIDIGGKPRVGAYRDTAFKVGLFRGSTELYDAHDAVADNSDNYDQISGIVWLDSPGNAATYTYYYKIAQTSNFGSNRASILANYATITLMELGPNP